MTQICKQFAVMNPVCGRYSLGPIHDNFKSCSQLRMLIIGELRELRNNKGSRDLTAVSLQIPVSGGKHNVSNPVFSLCMLESFE